MMLVTRYAIAFYYRVGARLKGYEVPLWTDYWP